MVDFSKLKLDWGVISNAFKGHVKEHNGAYCPCCNQFAKEYKRKLNSSIAACLVILYKMDQSKFHHVGTILAEKGMTTVGRDFALLKHWGLVEEQVNTLTEKRSAGYWKITDAGIAFASGMTRLPAYKYIYNNEVTGESVEDLNIGGALANRFNYGEL